jgi:hypothetical protein
VLDPGQAERAALKLFLDDGTPLGVYRRGKVPEGALVADSSVGESLAIDLSSYKAHFVAKPSSGRIPVAHRVGFRVELEGLGDACFAWEDAELNIYTTE